MVELRQNVSDFLDQELASMLNPTMLRCFQCAKNQRHYTVLISSSPEFLVEEIARRLHFHASASTTYGLTSQGEINAVEILMEGETKARYVDSLIETLGLPRAHITAYSDSHLDIPFLSAVGQPIAVNPDHTLDQHAKRCGWKVIKLSR